jgi:FkbM family methyltransferase
VTEFIPLDQVQWKTVRFLERPDESFEYEFILPEPLASWDVFAVWERERFHSMRDNLSQGDVLFDVGTEQGWCNLIYASFVGPDNMVLIEPTPEFWPNIQATWDKNYAGVGEPLRMYDGLFSDKTTETRSGEGADPFWEKLAVGWPDVANGPLIDRNKYQYVHEHSDGIPEIRLDDFVTRAGVVPDALTLDVEGAELLVLKGAEQTLRTYRPKCWVSVHPDLGEEHYGVVPADVHDFMSDLGYRGTFLAEDHEQHWFYEPT